MVRPRRGAGDRAHPAVAESPVRTQQGGGCRPHGWRRRIRGTWLAERGAWLAEKGLGSRRGGCGMAGGGGEGAPWPW
eukprot:scaffold22043_cov84-Isochrysis_galbana.AAC.5